MKKLFLLSMVGLACNLLYADGYWKWSPPVTNQDRQKYNSSVLAQKQQKRLKALEALKEYCKKNNPFKQRRSGFVNKQASVFDECLEHRDFECLKIILEFQEEYDCRDELFNVLTKDVMVGYQYAWLKEQGFNLDFINSHGNTLLDKQITQLGPQHALWLLNNTSIDPNHQDKNGNTSLHFLATTCAYKRPFDQPITHSMAEFIIKHKKGNPTLRNKQGKTPAHIAQRQAWKVRNDKTLCDQCHELAQALEKWETEFNTSILSEHKEN